MTLRFFSATLEVFLDLKKSSALVSHEITRPKKNDADHSRIASSVNTLDTSFKNPVLLHDLVFASTLSLCKILS